jgi:hypothetical protein
MGGFYLKVVIYAMPGMEGFTLSARIDTKVENGTENRKTENL